MCYGLGIDIGGTKIATVIINEHGDILNRVEVLSDPSDKEKMFKQVITSIESILLDTKLDISNIEGMGIGVPGKVDRENGIAVFQNNLPWKEFPIVERIQDYFPIKNIVIDNDVYMAAFAEWKVSEINKHDSFVYVTVSTGISCSIIQEGSFIRGAGFAGEIGLVPVLEGKSSNSMQTLEKSASGPAIQKLAAMRLNRPGITTKGLFEAYKNGDSGTHSVMEEVVDSLTRGIYGIICLLDPHKIVFGGGVMNNHPYLLDLVKDRLSHYVIPEQKHAIKQMQLSKLKGDSGVVGAGLRGLESVKVFENNG